MKIHLSLVTIFLALTIFAGSSNAALYVVNSTADSRDQTAGDGLCRDADGRCTLRAAIEESNAGTSEIGDSIVFSSNNPTIINLTLGTLTITKTVGVYGPRAGLQTVQRNPASGTPNFGIFAVVRLNSSTAPRVAASFQNLNIANGAAVNGGGGIYVASDCSLGLSESVVRDNTAVDSVGGGILTNGTVYISRSLISGNTASQGGGLSNQSNSVTTIENSTFTGNAAVGTTDASFPGYGGGIANFAQLSLTNVTISGNRSTAAVGGVASQLDGITSLRNTIIADNQADTDRDVSGNFNTLGNNLIGSSGFTTPAFPAGNPNANGDLVGTSAAPLDPLLGELQNNGGLTDTRALLPNSPAIDAGNNCVLDGNCPGTIRSSQLTTDQRGEGYTRRFNSAVDIGAFELQLSRPNIPTRFDFDGDGRADLSVFRPSNGTWYLQQSSAGFAGFAFGASSDRIIPADYDGDGKTDFGVYRAGTWYLQRSRFGSYAVNFGNADDLPVPADYDGIRRSSLAVFRPSTGVWYIQQPFGGFSRTVSFGQTGDRPIPADYDGDGRADIAVYRSGIWHLNRSTQGFASIQFGLSTDIVVPADYDGDGKTDLAVFRPSNGTWYLQQSTAGFAAIRFGQAGDAPVAADYDGDGKADLAVFRNGTWYLNRSTDGFTGVQFGFPTDQPIPNAFVR